MHVTFHRFKDMDNVKQVHSFEPNISLNRIFSLFVNYAKPRILILNMALLRGTFAALSNSLEF